MKSWTVTVLLGYLTKYCLLRHRFIKSRNFSLICQNLFTVACTVWPSFRMTFMGSGGVTFHDSIQTTQIHHQQTCHKLQCLSWSESHCWKTEALWTFGKLYKVTFPLSYSCCCLLHIKCLSLGNTYYKLTATFIVPGEVILATVDRTLVTKSVKMLVIGGINYIPLLVLHNIGQSSLGVNAVMCNQSGFYKSNQVWCSMESQSRVPAQDVNAAAIKVNNGKRRHLE